MISPSVRNTSRSTPCVLGCCGPMLTNISSVRTSNSTIVGSCGRVAVAISLIAFDLVFTKHAGATNHCDNLYGTTVVRMDDPEIAEHDFATARQRGTFHNP